MPEMIIGYSNRGPVGQESTARGRCSRCASAVIDSKIDGAVMALADIILSAEQSGLHGRP